MKLVSFAVAHKFQLKVSTCNGGFSYPGVGSSVKKIAIRTNDNKIYERWPLLTGLFSCFRARNIPRPTPHYLNTRNRLRVDHVYVSENFYDIRAFGENSVCILTGQTENFGQLESAPGLMCVLCLRRMQRRRIPKPNSFM